MSALNTSSNLSVPQSLEFTVGSGLHRADTSTLARTVLPSYATNGLLTVSQVETLSVAVPYGAIGAGATVVATGTQGLTALWAITLAPWDSAQFVLNNVSVIVPVGSPIIVGHPTIILVDGSNRQYATGQLPPGQGYTGMSVQVTANVYSPSIVGAGTITVRVSAMLVGGAQDH